MTMQIKYKKQGVSLPLFLTLILTVLPGCRDQANLFSNVPGTGSDYEVWVIQEFWHTGIVFSIGDIDPEHWPQIEKYSDRNYIDIGWGDEKFYQAHGNPVLLAARAILWPTQSVMQVFAFNTHVTSAYGTGSRILKIPLSGEQFIALTKYISDSYILDDKGKAITSTAYGDTDHYFLATRKYHLFRTCNTWVAKAFRNAGLDVRSFCVLNANQLFRQLSRIPGAEFSE